MGPVQFTSVIDLGTICGPLWSTVLELVTNNYGTIRKTYEMEPPTSGVLFRGEVYYRKLKCRRRFTVTNTNKRWEDSRWPRRNLFIPRWWDREFRQTWVYGTRSQSRRNCPWNVRESGPFKPVIWIYFSRIKWFDSPKIHFEMISRKDLMEEMKYLSPRMKGVSNQEGRSRNENLRTKKPEKKSASHQPLLSPFRSLRREENILLHEEVCLMVSVSRGLLCHSLKEFKIR